MIRENCSININLLDLLNTRDMMLDILHDSMFMMLQLLAAVMK